MASCRYQKWLKNVHQGISVCGWLHEVIRNGCRMFTEACLCVRGFTRLLEMVEECS